MFGFSFCLSFKVFNEFKLFFLPCYTSVSTDRKVFFCFYARIGELCLSIRLVVEDRVQERDPRSKIKSGSNRHETLGGQKDRNDAATVFEDVAYQNLEVSSY